MPLDQRMKNQVGRAQERERRQGNRAEAGLGIQPS